jgi:hypothetical protein
MLSGNSVVSRKNLLVGVATTFALAACNGSQHAFAPFQPQDSPESLAGLMRSAGASAVYRPDGTSLVLPEARLHFSTAGPFSQVGNAAAPANCVQAPQLSGKRAQSTCASPAPTAAPDLPVIATVVAHCGCGTATVNAGQGQTVGTWLFGATFIASPGYLGLNQGSGLLYGILNFNLNCGDEALVAASSGLATIAQTITYANSGYAQNLVENGKWYLAGGISAVEFASLLLSFCGPAELLGLLALGGLTVGSLLLLIKCQSAG